MTKPENDFEIGDRIKYNPTPHSPLSYSTGIIVDIRSYSGEIVYLISKSSMGWLQTVKTVEVKASQVLGLYKG